MSKKTIMGDRPSEIPFAAIAAAAYFKAEERGFAPGQELADWFAAEREFASKAQEAPRKARKKAAGKKKVVHKK
jgi:hypothetical protein